MIGKPLRCSRGRRRASRAPAHRSHSVSEIRRRAIVCAECESGDEAIAAVKREAPDVAVLDVEMPGMHGMDAAALIAPHVSLVVVCTAHASYAAQAFDRGAVDYVLKPVDAARLKIATIDRARARRDERRAGSPRERSRSRRIAASRSSTRRRSRMRFSMTRSSRSSRARAKHFSRATRSAISPSDFLT